MELDVNSTPVKIAEKYYNVGWSQGYDQCIEYINNNFKNLLSLEELETLKSQKFIIDRKEK